MRVTVRLFARLRDLTGAGELIREVPPHATARQVWDDLSLEWPALRAYEKTMSVAVNAEYARMSVDGDCQRHTPEIEPFRDVLGRVRCGATVDRARHEVRKPRLLHWIEYRSRIH